MIIPSEMNYREHCEDNGVGCAKHSPTLRLVLSPGCASWMVDEDCPGLRCVWPAAIERHTCDDPGLLDAEYATQLRRMGLAYAWLLDTRLPMRGRFALLRRIWKAEKLRAKGKIVAGKTVEI
jgi:hypothetical protein